MWASLEVVNFQSLKDVRLQLGKLTVIVGPSSSGKSALVRALRVLVQNGRGSGYVRHGSSSAAVGVQREDGVAVSIQRGALNEYRLASCT
jgi:exonuclease SbcC